jgi:VanZ family protein
VSGDLSDRLLWRLLAALSPAFAGADSVIQSDAVELLSFFERKAAHMFIYFVLALLLYLALSALMVKRRKTLSAVLCLLLASLDEYHQTFIDGRSGQLRDVLVDLTGGLLALLLLAILGWMLRNRHRRRFWLPCGLLAGMTAALSLLLVCLPTAALTGLPPFAWAAGRFVPAFSSMTASSQADLLAALAPILQEVLPLVLLALALFGCVVSALTWFLCKALPPKK